MKEKNILVAAILISISLLVSSIIVSTSINSLAKATITASESKAILNVDEAAAYLKISTEELLNTVKKDTNGNNTGLNYINVNGKYSFSKAALDEWVKTSKINITN